MYMSMCANSIKMLRKYNKNIPVKVIFIKCDDRIEKNNKYINEETFEKACDILDVEVIIKPWINVEGEEGYFPINKIHLRDFNDDSLLFIDGDTFIFGDVEELFEKYNNDFVACENKWMYGKNWPQGCLPIKPYNAGVMLFNNKTYKRCFGKLEEICKSIMTDGSAISRWMHDTGCTFNREEIAISIWACAVDNDYFLKTEAHNVYYPQEIEKMHETTIFHCYTFNWKKIYFELNYDIRKSLKAKKFVKMPKGIQWSNNV